MKILFFGLGSIGQRHLRNLLQLGSFDLYAYRVRNLPLPDEFKDVSIQVINDLNKVAEIKPDLCIIAAPPTFQEQVLPYVVNAGCNFFIEKPIAATMEGMEELQEKIAQQGLMTMVGYNLRYHPVHKKLEDLIKANAIGKIVSIRSSVGQWLPDWHPLEDYRQGYSANKKLGGGVILDLIHEIDFVYSLFGNAAHVKAMFGKNSSLEMDTEDTAEILMRFESDVIGSVHLDYVQRQGTRNGVIIGDEGTIFYDLLSNEVVVTGKEGEREREKFEFVRNDMYYNEMRDLLQAIESKRELANNFKAGLEVLRIALKAKEDEGKDS